MMKIEGFKVFDKELKCRGFQFEIGKTFHQGGEIKLCENGFHFCEKLIDCFNYYNFDSSNRVCRVIGYGCVDKGNGDNVAVSDIEILEELNWFEVLSLVNTGTSNTGSSNTGHWNTGDSNTGHWNTGDSNTGKWNTGDRNTGKWNTGHWNTGDSNTGDRNTGKWNTGHNNTGHNNTGKWNSGNWNTGFLNTTTPDVINVFNKPCPREEFESFRMPSFMFFNVVRTVDGVVTPIDYKKAFKDSWENADKKDRMRIKDCPNFDYDIFFEISGIDVREYE